MLATTREQLPIGGASGGFLSHEGPLFPRHRLGLAPRAQAPTPGTGQAQAAVGALADRERGGVRAHDLLGKALFQSRSILRRVMSRDPLARALQEPVDDLHLPSPVAQDGE